MAELTLVESIAHALDQEMARDDKVMVLGEDVGRDGGIFRATDGLIDKYGPDRVVDTPLAESAIIGGAIGLAIAGMKPVPELQFDGFTYQAFHQIESHVARYRRRTNGKFTCPLVIRFPVGAGVRALEHHSEAPEPFYGYIPGLKVVVPRSPKKAWAFLKAAVRDPDPVIFMEPKALYRKGREEVPDTDDDFVPPAFGKAEVLREGDDVTIVSYGHMLHRVVSAAKDLVADGVDPEIIDLQSISPLDGETIVESVKRTGRLVVVTENHPTYGVASEIIARVNEECLLWLEAPPLRVSAYDIHTPLLAREEHYMPTIERIKMGVNEVVNFQT